MSLKDFFKQPFQVILLLLGFVLLLSANFRIDDILKLSISPLENTNIFLTILGIILIIVAILLHLKDASLNLLPLSTNVKKDGNEFLIEKGKAEIRVKFGRLETIDTTENDCLIALPANEYFDDDCINDTRSALGAFMKHHFPYNIDDIQNVVRQKLQSYASQKFEREPGNYYDSFGVGTCVYLEHPLSSTMRIGMVSVTTKRAGEGLRAEASNIFSSIESLSVVMADHRLNKIYIPLLGSGHGGLEAEVSLLCMLIAFSGILDKHTGHHVKSINIIIFKKNKNYKPVISSTQVRKALAFTNKFC